MKILLHYTDEILNSGQHSYADCSNCYTAAALRGALPHVSDIHVGVYDFQLELKDTDVWDHVNMSRDLGCYQVSLASGTAKPQTFVIDIPYKYESVANPDCVLIEDVELEVVHVV